MLLGDCYIYRAALNHSNPAHNALNETTLTDETGYNHLAMYYKSLIKHPLVLWLIYKYSQISYN